MSDQTSIRFEMKGQFTPENSALVLIDYQIGTLQWIRNVSSDVSLRNAILLIRTAKRLGIPLILTSSQEDHLQGPLAAIFEKLAPDEYAARVKRAGIVNAWADPNFSAAIEATGRKNLIMGGVTTDICLVFPAISAVQLGYSVQAVIDAGGSIWEIQEEMARRRMEQAGVVLTTTNTVVAELVGDWSSPAGSDLIVKMVAMGPMVQEVS